MITALQVSTALSDAVSIPAVADWISLREADHLSIHEISTRITNEDGKDFCVIKMDYADPDNRVENEDIEVRMEWMGDHWRVRQLDGKEY